jgi:hypothetical protein
MGGKARGRKLGAAAAGASGSSRGGPASLSWRDGAGAPRGAAKGGSCASGARARSAAGAEPHAIRPVRCLEGQGVRMRLRRERFPGGQA